MAEETALQPCDYGSLHKHDDEAKQNDAEENGDLEVSMLEQFSDLVIGVVIHLVAEPMETVGASSLWFVIRVFFLFMLWQGEMLFMKYGRLFSSVTSTHALQFGATLDGVCLAHDASF